MPRGLSLVEVLIVIAIILVLAGLLFPSYGKALFKAKAVKTQVEHRNADVGDD